MKKILYVTLIIVGVISCAADSDSGTGASEGTGGSMARFASKGDVLYTVSTDTLKIFNISEPANPKYFPERDLRAGFDIETVFPMNDMLFIGSRSGMYVYDITIPKFPVILSEVRHIRSCDPVVAQGNYAYVTLNTNFNSCGSSTNNVLDIYDIGDPLNPVLKQTVQLNGPMGLGIDGNKLFVCDKGLKVFNVSDPINIRQIDDLAEIDEVNIRSSYDVIPVNGLLILIAKEGLYQFDYTGEDLKFMSKMEVNR